MNVWASVIAAVEQLTTSFTEEPFDPEHIAVAAEICEIFAVRGCDFSPEL